MFHPLNVLNNRIIKNTPNRMDLNSQLSILNYPFSLLTTIGWMSIVKTFVAFDLVEDLCNESVGYPKLA